MTDDAAKVAEIAKGLSKAQLIALGLFDDDGDAYQIRARLTPLGLAVRAHLTGKADA